MSVDGSEDQRQAGAGGNGSPEEEAPKKRKRTVWRRRTTMGEHGPAVLGDALYRLVALPRSRIAEWLDLSEAVVRHQLRYLREAGLIAMASDRAVERIVNGEPGKGRPHACYYLTRAGAEAGARVLGQENPLAAVDDYGRGQMPTDAAHRTVGNEAILALWRRASEKGSGVRMPRDEVFAESWPRFPVFGSGRPPEPGAPVRKESWQRIVPDATFVLEADGLRGGAQRFFMEVERSENGIRAGEVPDKVRRYGCRWRRILAPENRTELRFHGVEERLEPLVFVTETTAHAVRLHRRLRKRVPEYAEWSLIEETVRERTEGETTFNPMRLVLVAGLEEVRCDPLGRVYRPLSKYPEADGVSDGWRVGLLDAARLAGRVTPPPKAEAKERVEALEAERKEKAS